VVQVPSTAYPTDADILARMQSRFTSC